ncbi:MAG: YtxH domain-containing protein [Pedobacter sp.]|nr:MAG: YtxH domain-containing protein [Pedobacter sp.]
MTMNYQKILKSSLQSRRNANMATVAVIGGVAVGIAIGALFATKKGRKTKSKIINFFAKITGKVKSADPTQELGNIVENVRGHIKQNAEGLLGAEADRHDISEIHVEGTGTSAWKNQQEKTIFPNEPNPKIIYN